MAVDGSNCIVFTTLHWRTQIFSDNTTILAGSVGGGGRSYTCRKTQTEREKVSLLHGTSPGGPKKTRNWLIVMNEKEGFVILKERESTLYTQADSDFSR